MSEIHLREDSRGILNVEIVPSKENKWFWILWSVSGLLILVYGWHELGSPRLKTLPLWFILWSFFAILIFKAWGSWIWHSRGKETLRIEGGRVVYVRSGSFLDTKTREFLANELTEVVVLTFGLGDSLEPNRLKLKIRNASFYMGRSISKSQGNQLCAVLKRFTSNH